MLGMQRHSSYDQSSVLSAGEDLKAMAIASIKVGAGVSLGHGEIASIGLPATHPSSALPRVTVAKGVIRKNLFAQCCRGVSSHSQSRGPKDKGDQNGKMYKRKFRKYDNVDQNK